MNRFFYLSKILDGYTQQAISSLRKYDSPYLIVLQLFIGESNYFVAHRLMCSLIN